MTFKYFDKHQCDRNTAYDIIMRMSLKSIKLQYNKNTSIF